MRRSRVFLGIGSALTIVVAVALPSRSHAADEPPPPAALELDGRAVSEPLELKVLPLLARHDASLFGSFLGPGARPSAQASDSACAPDMVEVEGDYCPYVEQRCLKWTDPSTKLQCEEFERLPSAGRCFMKTDHKHFCIDRYEWPNKVGALPAVMANWDEAKTSCEAVGKRLCSDTEWTLSCEGPERTPYPYGGGYARDSQACNIDKPYIWPHPEKVYDPNTQVEELARLDQREPSGARASCVSPYGVRDMVGNVDEWVVNASQAGKPHISALKGGYWGPVRTRCRSITTGHGETFKYYQIGFRCCGEARSVDTSREPLVRL